jgi:hypothetical protein
MSLRAAIAIIIIWSLNQNAMTQNPIGLQVDSGQTVLFGKDTLCCGDRFMWLPSKKALFVGARNFPQDTIGEY